MDNNTLYQETTAAERRFSEKRLRDSVKNSMYGLLFIYFKAATDFLKKIMKNNAEYGLDLANTLNGVDNDRLNNEFLDIKQTAIITKTDQNGEVAVMVPVNYKINLQRNRVEFVEDVIDVEIAGEINKYSLGNRQELTVKNLAKTIAKLFGEDITRYVHPKEIYALEEHLSLEDVAVVGYGRADDNNEDSLITCLYGFASTKTFAVRYDQTLKRYIYEGKPYKRIELIEMIVNAI